MKPSHRKVDPPQPDRSEVAKQENKWPFWRIAALVVVGLMAVAITLGYLYSDKRRRDFEDSASQNLVSVATLKAAQVAAWRAERAGDARVIAADVTLMPVVQRVLRAEASSEQKRQVRDWVVWVRDQYRYKNVVLLSLNGEILLSGGQLLGGPDHFRQIAAETGPKDDLVFGDLVRVDGGPIHLDVSIALKDEKGQRLGVLLLAVDPSDYLYPSLYDWPAPGRTGEVLLLRQEGKMIRVLNQARLSPGSALKIMLPVIPNGSSASPSWQGVDRKDREDYRGEHVVVSARPVPGCNWVVAAKMDRSELLEPLRREAMQLTALLVMFLFLSAAIVALLLSRQRSRSYMEKYQTETQRVALLRKYDVLFQGAYDAIVVWEGEGRIVDANARALEMYGYTREEMLGAAILNLKPSELRDEYHESMKVLKEQNSLVRETISRRKDGTLFSTEISSCRVEDGEHPFFQTIVRDISERKRAEGQITRLNRLYAVLSGCHEAVFRSRSEQELFAEVCRIVVEAGGFLAAGISRLDPMAGEVTAVTTAGPAAAYLQKLRVATTDSPLDLGPRGTCLRTGRAVTCADTLTDESMAPWRDKALGYGLRSSVSLPIQHRGEAPYALSMYSSTPHFFNAEEMALAERIGESVSSALERMALERDRENAERERRRVQERLELVLDASNEGYWDWEMDTNEWYVSPRLCTMLGYQPGELKLIPQVLQELVHPEDREAVERAEASLLEGRERAWSMELRFRQKNGNYIWVLGGAKALGGDQGRPRRLVGSGIDITARKALEQQFAQSQKMESVGRLAGGVAHDFNNLLGVVIGYTEILQERLPEDSDLRAFAEDVLRAAHRAADLTRQLLAFGRKQVLQPQVLALNPVIQDFEKMLRRVISENIRIRTVLGASEGWVCADAGQIEQVIMNLAVNARDAMPEGGTLTIETQDVDVDEVYAKMHVSAQPGPFVMIAVNDTGCGMTPELIERIFEPFFTTKEKGKGTGLGLGSVYGIVQQSGGWIGVYSEPGQGSSFKVYLPRVTEGGAAATATPQVEAGMPHGTGTILVAEDETDMRNLAQNVLQRLGYKVLTAANGAIALRLAQDFPDPIHLLLTDVIMPEVGGRELAERMAQARPETPVLYMSGYTSDGAITQSVLASEVAFIQKPFTAAAIAQKIHEVLGAQNDGPRRNTVESI
jgi:PAS domain S-box-containing protein